MVDIYTQNNEEELIAAATAGDLVAQYKLSNFLDKKGDKIAARDWLEKAAAGKLPEALVDLANAVYFENNASLAMELFQQAADAGSSDGYYYLAILHYNDGGFDDCFDNLIVARELHNERAKKLLAEFADNEDPVIREKIEQAHYRFHKRNIPSLIVTHSTPKVITQEVQEVQAEELPKEMKKCPFCAELIKQDALKCRFCGEFLDRAEARISSRLSQPSSDMQEQYDLAMSFYNGNGIDRNPYKAASLLTKLAKAGFVDAQFMLAQMYDRGDGVEQNLIELAYWYKAAADQGHAEAQYMYGLCLDGGTGVPLNSDEALLWFLKAAEQDNSHALKTLGDKYWNGIGVLEDLQMAIQYYEKGAALGDAECCFNAGLMYTVKEFQGHDDKRAFALLKQAAELGSPSGMNILGVRYADGIGVCKDIPRGFLWLCKAAELGDENAEKNIVAVKTNCYKSKIPIQWQNQYLPPPFQSEVNICFFEYDFIQVEFHPSLNLTFFKVKLQQGGWCPVSADESLTGHFTSKGELNRYLAGFIDTFSDAGVFPVEKKVCQGT